MNELSLIDTLTPAVFTEKGKLDSVIEDITSRVANFNGDLNTAKGREEIKSFAFRIAKSKTAIDALGKECVQEWKKKSKVVDTERKRVWDALESLQKEVRQPVTDWESLEKDRVEVLKNRITDLAVPANTYRESVKLRQVLADIEAIIIDESFEELKEIAEATKIKTIDMLQDEISHAVKRELDAEELLKLRQEAAVREQKDREEAIKKEATDRATREAEAKAQTEREAVIRREAEAKAETEKKALEAKLVIERAEREKLEAQQRANRAVEQERQRVEAKKAKLEAEEAKREANKKYKAGVHKGVIDALKSAGVDTSQADIALNAICKGLIPNISISY